MMEDDANLTSGGRQRKVGAFTKAVYIQKVWNRKESF